MHRGHSRCVVSAARHVQSSAVLTRCCVVSVLRRLLVCCGPQECARCVQGCVHRPPLHGILLSLLQPAHVSLRLACRQRVVACSGYPRPTVRRSPSPRLSAQTWPSHVANHFQPATHPWCVACLSCAARAWTRAGSSASRRRRTRCWASARSEHPLAPLLRSQACSLRFRAASGVSGCGAASQLACWFCAGAD